MTREAVDKLLRDARQNRGRLLHLRTEMSRLSAEIELARGNLEVDAATAYNYELSDMPRGTAVGRPTEQIGLKLASGWEPDHIKAMEQEMQLYQQEYDKRYLDELFVTAWLEGLPERERWLIETQVIDGVFWRDVLIRYRKKFGTDASKDTLQRVKTKALEQIYDMAQ